MSIQSEIDRIRGNVQDTISAIQQTGVTVPEGANSDNLPSLAAALANEKQDRLTGTSGQFVGFDSGGNAAAVAAPTAASIGALPTSGGTMTGQVQFNQTEGTILSFPVMDSTFSIRLYEDPEGYQTARIGTDSVYMEIKDDGTGYVQGITLNGNVSGITPASIGAVPTSRTVNGKALSANISLTAADVNAFSAAGGMIDGDIDLQGHTISNLGMISDAGSIEVYKLTVISEPSSPNDAATKEYVDDLVGNINSALDAINGEVI